MPVTKQIIVDSEKKAQEYSACRIGLGNKKVVFRVAKTTKDRPGQFVAIWKRSKETGKIIPLDKTDVEFVIISVMGKTKKGKSYQGQFIFNREILLSNQILSHGCNQGKLAMRVFPPWAEELSIENIEKTKKVGGDSKKNLYMSLSAKKTQQWQLKYFFAQNCDGTAKDINLVKEILFK